MLSFKSPDVLFLLILVPFLVYYVNFRKGRGGKIDFNHSVWKSIPFKPPVNLARIFSIGFWACFWAGVICFMIALAGPMTVEKEKIFLTRGIDMIITLDESPSMSATDFKPTNRFTAAKKVITEFTLGRENDQIGLVAYASQAALMVPPTQDYTRLLEILESLQIKELGNGTAIGKGISVAALHLKSSKALEKVIILITDGVNNEGDMSPEDAALLARQLGIRIYTIGVGKESDSSWEYTDPETGDEFVAPRGEYDEKLLMKIAYLSGGKYFYAGKPSALTDIFKEIDSIEKTEKRIKVFVKQNHLHEGFILFGLILILAGFFGRKWFLEEIL